MCICLPVYLSVCLFFGMQNNLVRNGWSLMNFLGNDTWNRFFDIAGDSDHCLDLAFLKGFFHPCTQGVLFKVLDVGIDMHSLSALVGNIITNLLMVGIGVSKLSIINIYIYLKCNINKDGTYY